MTPISRLVPLLLGALFLGAYARVAFKADHVIPGTTFENWHVPAPPLNLQDLEGHPHTLKEFSGRVVLVHFWSTWCEPCREEVPALSTFAERYKARGLYVLAVNVGETTPTITNFALKWPMPGLVLQDRSGDAFRQWNAHGIPATFLIDRDGTIRGSGVGELDWTSTETGRKIDTLLGTTASAQQKTNRIVSNEGGWQSTGAGRQLQRSSND